MTDQPDQAEIWSSVAAAWDENIDDLDDGVLAATDAMVASLTVSTGDRVLEVGCGPGTLGAMWSRLVGPTGTVLLGDIAPGMVEVAERRTASLGNVEVALVDVAAIDRPDSSLDVAASRFGLMFTPDPSVAFAELHRVLAPGGRMAALTWAAIEHNPWMSTLGMAAVMAGILEAPPPPTPGSPFSLADPDELAALASAGGFADVAVTDRPVTFAAPDLDTHLDTVSQMAGPIAGAIAAASDDQRSKMREVATELAAPYVAESGVELPGRALLVSGRR